MRQAIIKTNVRLQCAVNNVFDDSVKWLKWSVHQSIAINIYNSPYFEQKSSHQFKTDEVALVHPEGSGICVYNAKEWPDLAVSHCMIQTC